jgi:hypothetical protein
MLDLLLLNTRVHLKFFARNRLLLALAFVVSGGFALSLVPAVFMVTTISRFELLRLIVTQLGSMTLLVTSSLGLFAVTAHLRSRSLKMVVTKPCPPEVWLGSIFLAGSIVTAGLHLAMAAIAAIFSFAWGVPYQTGFAFIAIDGFLRAMIWFSYLTALAVAFHPVVAVLLALLLNEGTLYGLKFMIAASVKAKGSSWLLAAASRLVDAVYMILPMLEPLSDKTSDIYSSLRTVSADWPLLLEIAGYTALVMAFFYCLSDLLIRRRSLA